MSMPTGVTLYLGLFDDGGRAECEVTDLKGKTVLTVRAERKENAIYVHSEGGKREHPIPLS